MSIYKISFSTGNKCMYFVQIFEVDAIRILRIMNSAFSSTHNYGFTYNDIVVLFSLNGSFFIPFNRVGLKMKDRINSYLNAYTNSLNEFKMLIIEKTSSFISGDYIEIIDCFVSGDFPSNPPSFMKVEEIIP